MRFLDAVAQAREAIAVACPGDATVWRFPGADVLASELSLCPLRYVLHDDVTAVCTRLAFEDDTILGSSIELVRIPAPTLWIEFVGSARHGVFADLDRLDVRANPSSRQRVGILVTADARGRRGSADVCWENGEGLSPDLAPFTVEYDFDDEGFSERGAFSVSVSDFPALSALFNRVRFRLRPEWHRYYAQRAKSPDHYRDILRRAVDPLLEDVPFLAVFCLLLSSGNALRQEPADRSRLNMARARRSRPPLLDHVELTMNLAHGNTNAVAVGERSSPRLHFVRGHLVRRGDAVHWRTSHIRGKAEVGSIRSRTVALRIAG